MTQKELAEIVHTTEVSISRYTNDTRIPKGDIVVKIANALHTTTDFLLSEEESITLHLPMSSAEAKTECRFREESVHPVFSEAEKQLLDNYNRLSQKMKKVLLRLSETLLKEEEEKNCR
ncbi:helix-turn-helix domain-containing protein [Acetivibrio sp. MSJd-27]|uniref:helix-turn-helix domain-containing protein n=1 Tax=Acetivibrio sp. MSJd-27 TaxID=2841523 RepID=UPI001C103478|nr:helix-turn-helix domain-containing protein [Acetivibrio sp. MSJd-27]MBU5450996.1 helix-turn-helix domain-containing protein [Acetivibrio sp. MSJd-27]